MLIKRKQANLKRIENCHNGQGEILCLEYIDTMDRENPGIRFIHDDVIKPGNSVGCHTHTEDEEIYVILEGKGVMEIDGKRTEVEAGDVCVTRSGGSHSLENTGDSDIRVLVVGVNI